MTDKKILEEVYRRSTDKNNWAEPFLTLKGIKDFIEREWQRRDEDELENSIMWGDDGSTKKAGDSSYFV